MEISINGRSIPFQKIALQSWSCSHSRKISPPRIKPTGRPSSIRRVSVAQPMIGIRQIMPPVPLSWWAGWISRKESPNPAPRLAKSSLSQLRSRIPATASVGASVRDVISSTLDVVNCKLQRFSGSTLVFQTNCYFSGRTLNSYISIPASQICLIYHCGARQ